ncbi:MAG: helix-turn-helix transcriptional regulator [Magnetococcales bacterium]|nr:helix-turn-helix transcriptional regulator [Magnetococcales bacterium]
MMQKPTSNVCVRLRSIRKELDLTQQGLSDRIGVSRAYIADVEAGRKEPSRNFIVKLTESIQISGDWLLSGTGEMFREGARGSVRDRLVRMLALTERDVDGWLSSLNLDPKNSGTLDQESGFWNDALLTRIQRQEGIRPEWLLNGEGTPFPGGHHRSDYEAVSRLELVLAGDGGWHVYLVTDRAQFCVVLVAPAWSEPEQAFSYEYTIMEVIGGAVGRRTLAAVRSLLGRYAVYVVVVSGEALRRLVSGTMGIREFMGRGRIPGVLAGAIKIDLASQVDEYIPEPVVRIDAAELERACGLAAQDPRSARLLFWLSDWLPRATPEERIYLEGLLKRNFPDFLEPAWLAESDC